MKIVAKTMAFLRAALLENVGLKVFSLLCALSIYVFIHGAERVQRTFTVGVVSVMPPDSANRQLRTPLPTEVGVTLRGPRTQLDGLTSASLGSLRIDLRTGQETRISLDAGMLNIPPGMEVEHMFPASVNVRWDDVITSRVRVLVTRSGSLESGFVIQKTLVEPDTVAVRGARSVVDVMHSVRTAPFEVGDLEEGTHRRVLALESPPEGLTYDVDEVTAAVEIAREERTVTFSALAVEVVGLPRATTKPPTVTVRVRGPVALVRGVERDAIVPRIELPPDAPKSGSSLEKVVVDLGGLDLDIEPATVLVKW